MKHRSSQFWWLLFAMPLFALATDQPEAVHFDARELRILANMRLQAPPPDATNRYEQLPSVAKLGQALFFDTRFSQDGKMACATCHIPEKGFADGRKLAQGLETLDRHTQSLWQAAYQRWFFWDGRADSLWSQALQPFEDPQEMGVTRLEVLHQLNADPDLKAAYEQLFEPLPPLHETARFPKKARPMPEHPDHPNQRAWMQMAAADRQTVNRAFSHLGKAIAAYERRLIIRASPFDRFLDALAKGHPPDVDEFSQSAQRGLKLFIGKANCRLCHSGANLSDGEFHNNGVPPLKGGIPRDAGRWEGLPLLQHNPFNAAGAYSDAPNGKKAATLKSLIKKSELWGQFRTPSLRNIALSPPYMHQGQLPTLAAVVDFYADLHLAGNQGHHREPFLQPVQLSQSERADLVIFLHSLNGDPPNPNLLKPPATPVLSRP